MYAWVTASIEPWQHCWKPDRPGTQVCTEVVRGDGTTHVLHAEQYAYYRPHLLKTYEGSLQTVRTGSEYGFSYIFVVWFADPAKKRSDVGGITSVIPPNCNCDGVLVSSVVTHVGRVPLVDEAGLRADSIARQAAAARASAASGTDAVVGGAANLRSRLHRAALATVMVETLGAFVLPALVPPVNLRLHACMVVHVRVCMCMCPFLWWWLCLCSCALHVPRARKLVGSDVGP